MGKDIFKKIVAIYIVSVVFFTVVPQPGLAYEQEIKSLSATMAEHISQAGKKRIAVVDFTDLKGNVTKLGRFLANESEVALTGAGKANGFKVIERLQLKVILQEHKLSLTDIIDPSTVRKLGEIAGVDALLTGTITPFGDSVRLSVKVLDTATAEIVDASTVNIAKTKVIEELLAADIDSSQPQIGGQQAAASGESEWDTMYQKIYGSKGGQQPTTSGRASKFLPTIKVEEDGFSFEVKECKLKSGKTVELKVIVVNNEERERMLTINVDSLLTDNEGQQYKAAKIKFGSKEDSYVGVNQVLPPQLPTAATLIYGDVSPQVQSTTFRLYCNSNKGDFYPLLRNIPLTR